ncbi:unnamed protein product, partial [Polarella glacialis]
VEAQGRPGQLLFAASTKAEDEASSLHELAESAALGARQEFGDIDIARLMEESVLSVAPRLSASAGPLKFVSPKVERRVLGAGRGRGVVALQDLAVGEAFIVSRPLGLVTNAALRGSGSQISWRIERGRVQVSQRSCSLSMTARILLEPCGDLRAGAPLPRSCQSWPEGLSSTPGSSGSSASTPLIVSQVGKVNLD